MTAKIIKGINFVKPKPATPVEDILRDITIDLADAGELGKGAEFFGLMRYADGSYDIWASASVSVLTRVGELEVIKNHLMNLDTSEDDGE